MARSLGYVSDANSLQEVVLFLGSRQLSTAQAQSVYPSIQVYKPIIFLEEGIQM